MNVMVLQVFVSLVLVACAVLLFLYSARMRDHEHSDRLSLAPLEEDAPPVTPSPPAKARPSSRHLR